MEVYEEVRMRRAERYARRQERARRRKKWESIMRAASLVAQATIGVIMLYALLFFGALWASI